MRTINVQQTKMISTFVLSVFWTNILNLSQPTKEPASFSAHNYQT